MRNRSIKSDRQDTFLVTSSAKENFGLPLEVKRNVKKRRAEETEDTIGSLRANVHAQRRGWGNGGGYQGRAVPAGTWSLIGSDVKGGSISCVTLGRGRGR